MIANVGGIDDYDVLIAAILHDTVEDVGVTREEIAERWGEEVASIVAEVTDDKSLPKPERKRLQVEHAPHLSRKAKLVKIADKISNIRDVTNNPPKDWDMQRRIDYVIWGENVVAGLRGTNAALEMLFDETAEAAKKRFIEGSAE